MILVEAMACIVALEELTTSVVALCSFYKVAKIGITFISSKQTIRLFDISYHCLLALPR